MIGDRILLYWTLFEISGSGNLDDTVLFFERAFTLTGFDLCLCRMLNDLRTHYGCAHFLLPPQKISKSIVVSTIEGFWFDIKTKPQNFKHSFPVFPILFIFIDEKKKICVRTIRLLWIHLNSIIIFRWGIWSPEKWNDLPKVIHLQVAESKAELKLLTLTLLYPTASLHPLNVLKTIKFLPELGFIQCSSW